MFRLIERFVKQILQKDDFAGLVLVDQHSDSGKDGLSKLTKFTDSYKLSYEHQMLFPNLAGLKGFHTLKTHLQSKNGIFSWLYLFICR